MSWNDNPDLTEPSDEEFDPTMGVTGGERARPGDSYALAFLNDGEEIEIDGEARAEFAARLLEADFNPVNTDGETVRDGDDVRLLTGSARFLAELKEHAPVGGKTLRITVVDTGYSARYDIEEVDESGD